MGEKAKRYSCDVSDAQWELIRPLLPVAKAAGRPPVYPPREVVNAILYVTKNGCVWRDLPACFPPWRTVYYHFERWYDNGTLTRIHDVLRDAVRIRNGRDPAPSAGIIDSQSVKSAETVSRDCRGFDAGKKINGRKRHIIVDTLGLLLVVMVTAASVHDTTAARPAIQRLACLFPGVGIIWADGGYLGKLVTWANTTMRIALTVVKRTTAHQFRVLPRRWVVERTFAWITQKRRLARDYERTTAHAEAFIYWAMIHTMTQQLTKNT